MTTLVVVLTILCAALTLMLVWLLREHLKVRGVVDESDAQATAARNTLQHKRLRHEIEVRRLQERIDGAYAGAEAERARASEDVRKIHDMYLGVIDRLMNAVNYGATNRPEAVIELPEPNADERMARSIHEDVVNVGARRLQEEYAARGVVVSLEECQEEALAIASGTGLTAVLAKREALFVKDGG